MGEVDCENATGIAMIVKMGCERYGRGWRVVGLENEGGEGVARCGYRPCRGATVHEPYRKQQGSSPDDARSTHKDAESSLQVTSCHGNSPAYDDPYTCPVAVCPLCVRLYGSTVLLLFFAACRKWLSGKLESCSQRRSTL